VISVVIISKDEPALSDTLAGLVGSVRESEVEVVVVDASSGRLDAVRDAFPTVRWIDFQQRDLTLSIPHQRNEGLRATSSSDIVVFTDAGCGVEPEWLQLLTSPILDGTEEVTAGLTGGGGAWRSVYARDISKVPNYLDEAPTINLAMSRRMIDAVGWFDETFEYGSDIDYSWRVIASGGRIRFVPEAVVMHDWGTRRRQMKRSYRYGKARARLHRKHGTRFSEIVRRDPIVVAYPLFLLGLPLTLIFPIYPLVLLVPAWRARHSQPAVVIIDHLVYGAGALVEALR
jgi:glycosyltransferase involved in cell wall biosynthesis